MWTFFFLATLLGLGSCTLPDKVLFRKGNGLRVKDSLIGTMHAKDEFECSVFCSKESSCVSANFKHSGIDQGRCELNNKTLGESERKHCFKHPEYSYLEMVKQQCQSQSPTSEAVIKEPAVNSCKNLLEKDGSLSNGVYNIQDTSLNEYPVYCHMTEIPGCGVGGWTLVMKLDGSKDTFGYDSLYWSDNRTYGVQEGLQGLTDKETKLQSHWNTPFTKMCLGMKVNGVTKWIKLDYEATSLYSVIANGTFRGTTVGRNIWKGLIGGSYLQPNCNKEGFNIENYKFGDINKPLMIRLGIMANGEFDCISPNSWIGFGVKYHAHTTITTGNVGSSKFTSAIGYVLVS